MILVSIFSQTNHLITIGRGWYLEESKNSGQRDLNPRPTGPKPVALAKLRYTPIFECDKLTKFDYYLSSETFFAMLIPTGAHYEF